MCFFGFHEAPDHIGPPSSSHELLSYEVDKAIGGRSAGADPVARTVWVWAVARQLILLYEFEDIVVRHTLGIPAGADSDDALVDALLSGARTAISRLSHGGDQTSRVLGGGVENRWRTRLANVQEFLMGIVRIDGVSRKLLLKAGVTEAELRKSVSTLVKDSKRFIMLGRPRSPSPSGKNIMPGLVARSSPTPVRSPCSRPAWMSGSRSKSPGQKARTDLLSFAVPPFPGLSQDATAL